MIIVEFSVRQVLPRNCFEWAEKVFKARKSKQINTICGQSTHIKAAVHLLQPQILSNTTVRKPYSINYQWLYQSTCNSCLDLISLVCYPIKVRIGCIHINWTFFHHLSTHMKEDQAAVTPIMKISPFTNLFLLSVHHLTKYFIGLLYPRVWM